MKQLKLLKQLIRIGKNIVVKNIFDSQMKGRRKVGRQRAGWLEEVENDLRSLKVEIWMQKTMYRTIKQTKAVIERFYPRLRKYGQERQNFVEKISRH